MRSIFSLFIICLTSLSFGQIPDTLVKKIDDIFTEYDKTNSPGCALAILKDGEIIYERGYGISNLEYNLAITPTSIFHIASISKQFTAAAIIQLALEGKLSLDDDIRKYIPEVPDFGHTITLNHLIHHTSGIRDQWSLQYLSSWRFGDLITEQDIMDMLVRQEELNFLPGEEYLYCNTGFTLAGIAVKRITGVSLRDYADSVFFKPLGMASTHFHSDHAEITPNRTSAYQKDAQGKWKISIPVFDNYGATSLFTTVEDLAKWDENFYTKKIGGDAFIDLMRFTGELNDGTPQNYASGLVISQYKGYRTEGHGGADAGYRANLLRFPDEHFTVIIFANMANINTQLLSYKVADLFLTDKSGQNPKVVVDSNILKEWAGDYFDPHTQSIINFAFKNGKLMYGSTELIPRSTTVFANSFSTFTFSESKLSLETTGSKNMTFDKVEKIELRESDLKEYEGDFYSSELDTKYILFIKDNIVKIKSLKKDNLELSPFIKDIFAGPWSTVRFSRNKNNMIDGFFISTGRVRNLRFTKLATN